MSASRLNVALHGMRRPTLLLALFLVAWVVPLAAGADVGALATLGRVSVSPVFEPALARAYNPVALEVCAVGDFAGSVEITDRFSLRSTRVGPLSVRAGRCDERIVPIWIDGGGLLATVLDADGDRLGSARWSGRALTQPTVAVLDQALEGPARAEAVQVAIALPTTDRLPDDPLEWRGLGAVLLSLERLEALRPEVRSALDRWVELGGILVVVSDDDSPSSVRTGRGRMDVIARDNQEWLHGVFDDVYRRWGASARPGVLESATLYRFGGGENLDVSGHHVPPVWQVAVILFGAILLLAALRTRRARRRLGTMAPLLGAPLVGGAAFLALVGLGFAQKGGSPVVESVALLEVGSGVGTAAAQRVMGLLTTEAGTTHVRGRPGALLLPLPDPGGPEGRTEVRRLGDGAMDLRLAAGLWQTVYLREDSLVAIGGGVVLSRESAAADLPVDIQIENRTPFSLREAVLLVGPGAERVAVGDLGPGERRTIPMSRLFGDPPLPRAWTAAGLPVASADGHDVLLASLDPSVLPDLPGTRAERQVVLLRVEGP